MSSATPHGTSQSLERAAAFFDLDKTIIARASLAAFRAPLHENGLLSFSGIARSLAGQLIYLHLGTKDARIERFSESLLPLAAGWRQAEVEEIVEATLERVVDPIIYAEAIELIELHRAAGDLVVIVSAAPVEIVVPLGRHLGVDDVIATEAELDEEGRYTGRIARYLHGAHKAEAVRAFATARHIDLDRSFAYGDAASDVPMLELVGHPVAVNPDRSLARTAASEGWEITHFERPMRLRERVGVARPTPLVVSASSLVAGAGVVTVAWWLRRRHGARRAPAPKVEAL